MRPLSLNAWGVTPLFLAALLAACGDGSPKDPASITLLGNRADLVSDGDALAEIRLPKSADAASLKVTLNGKDATTSFSAQPDGRLLGLLTGLPVGKSTVEVSATGARAVQLVVTNAERGGPVLSGPQPIPFFCATVTPQAATATTPATVGSGLTTEAVDARCNIATEYKLYYRTTTAGCQMVLPDPSPPATPPTSPCFKPYTASASTPADMATTTTDTGLTVPYIVRVERGTMNRGIYDIAVLFDPAKPWTTGVQKQATWNGKVNYLLGASGGQPRRQLRSTMSWTHDDSLSRGWLVAVNSMSDASTNNNRVTVAETVMMMKERVIDRYGPVKFTMATGCSGGSISANATNSLNPGLFDGAIVSCTLLDYDTSHIENYECSLLVEMYDGTPWKNAMAAAGYTQAQINAKKAAINGHMDHTSCQGWYNNFGPQRYVGNNTALRQVPTANRETGTIVSTPLSPATNNCQLPAGLVWDPVTNPTGVRCGVWDWMSSIFGTLASGGANSTRDNTGMQYGLKALRSGAITAEEFVLMNENVGGVSRDGLIVPARTVADAPALDIAYRVGLIAARNLGSVAIIDLRGFDDSQTPPNAMTGVSGLHQIWRSFGLRERMDKANGGHANHVMWRYPTAYTPSAALSLQALLEMDKWLTALKADTSNKSVAQKVIDSKPATAFDYCLLSTDSAQSTKVTDTAKCDADPYLVRHASPRQVAGGPLAEDVLKCSLKPLDVADYAPAVLSAAQVARLRAVFPDGVCDWSKPGVGQQPTGNAPFSFVGGPGGVALPEAPTAR